MAFASPSLIASLGAAVGVSSTGGVTPSLQAPTGLFAGLLGGAETGTAIASLPTAPSADAASLTPTITQTVQLSSAAPALSVTGDSATVASFLQTVQAVVAQVTQSGQLSIGQLSNSQELAAALTKLGMDASQAAGVATQIETMLTLLKANLAASKGEDPTAFTQDGTSTDDTLSADAQGELAVLMLAAMLSAPAATTATETATESTATGTFQLSIQLQSPASTSRPILLSVQSFASSSDMARQMAGLEPSTAAPRARALHEAAPTVSLTVASNNNAPAGVTVSLSQTKAETDTTQADSTIAAQASAAALAAQTPVPVATVLQSAGVSEGAVQSARLTGQKVESADVLSKPEGTTLYRLENHHGTETLQAVAQAPAAQTVDPSAQQTIAAAAMAGAGGALSSAAGTHAASFGDQLATARQVQAAQQVAVHIKPLLEQGGGTVRMTLNPPELGQVTIELNIADGKVHGAIAATQPAVVEQLARELHSLRQGLANAGLQLGDQGLSLMLNQQNTQGQNQGQQQGGGAQHGGGSGGTGGGHAGSATVAEAETQLPASWISPDRVVDVQI